MKETITDAAIEMPKLQLALDTLDLESALGPLQGDYIRDAQTDWSGQ